MSEHQLRLYESSGSPNSRRVRIFLAEKGICIARVPVDLGAGEQHSKAYIQINPRRVVPTLVLEDGTVIGEVPAILRYLEEAHPNTPLLGTSPKGKALVTMWERRIAGNRFSVADITAIVTVDFATKALSTPIPEHHAALQRWYTHIAARPSMAA
jgi:glutathione S-transferase